MSAFDSVPNEVVARILASCDEFTQLLNLITTCKRLHSVWLKGHGTIIWEVGKIDVVCFDDALMAIRSTNIVKAAQEAGVRPPDPFPISTLSGKVQKPSQQELNHVFVLQHMARCIKHTIFNWETRRSHVLDFSQDALDTRSKEGIWFEEKEDGKGPWHENLCRALYRFVLLGAVFSGAFNQPLYSAMDTNSVIAQVLVTKGSYNEKFSRDTLQYLEEYPAYSSNPVQYEGVFKPYTDWLASDFNTRHKDDSGAAVREILHILVVYYHLMGKIVNGDCHESPGRYLGRPDFNNKGVRWNQGRGRQDTTHRCRPPPPSGFPGGTKKATVVLFGIFQVEDLSLPICIEDIEERYLFANPYEDTPPPSEGSRSEDKKPPTPFWDILSFLPRSGSYAPPAVILHFFSYALGNCNYRFTDKAFALDDDPGSHRTLPFHSLGWPVLFCDGVWGLNLVEQIGDV